MAEYRCSSCKKEYRSSGDVKYCMGCQEYVFTPCIEDREDCAPRASKEMQKCSQSVWTCGGTLTSVPPEVPDIQDIVTMNLSCEGRNSLENPLCISKTISNMKDTIQPDQPETLNHLKQSDQNRQIQYGYVQRGKRSIKGELEDMKEKCIKKIRMFRMEINQLIDEMELDSIAQLERLFTEMESVSKDNQYSVQSVCGYSSKGTREKEQIQRKVATHYDETEQSLNGVTDSSIACPVFIKNIKLTDTLKQFKSLGVFRLPDTQGLYQLQSEETVSVADPGDTEVCSIQSACLTCSGDVLLADFKNKNIKVLDSTYYKLKDTLSLQHYPLSVCNVNEVEAAVGLAETLYFGGNNLIQFLSTKDKLLPTRTIQLDHCCTGICVVESKIFVSNQRKRLYIYDLTGVLQKTVHIDQTGNEIFSKSYSIAVNENTKAIHVTDLNKGLITLDSDGNVQWKFSGPELKVAWGVCTDGKGMCFVAGGNSCNIVQIGPTGNYIGEVVPESNGIKDPQAVCFDKKTSRLIVTRYNSNTVHIFSLHLTKPV